MKTKNSERIKVAVRCRPMSDKEKTENHEKLIKILFKYWEEIYFIFYYLIFNNRCVAVDIDRGEITVKKTGETSELPRNFFFDKVFDER